jgi:predicted ATP-grasp superfamily ATP-dependent carboligase
MSPGTVLITIGRLPKALDFARAFHARGWTVIVAEPFERHLTGASNTVTRSRVTPAPSAGKAAYLDAVLDIVARDGVDLILPLSEETMHVAHLRDRLPAGVSVYAPPARDLLGLHDKKKFAALAARHGLTVPRTAALGSAEAGALAQSRDYVVKPALSCSGRGVVFGEAGTTPRPGSEDARQIVQQLIRGAHFSTFSIAHAGRVAITVVYRGLVMSGTVAVAFERVEHPAIAAWVEDFVARTGHTGFISFDFIVDADGCPHAIECNPRVTSGVHFIETEDLAAATLDPAAPTPRLRDTRWMQQFYPTLTETQGAVLDRVRFGACFRVLTRAKDVTWSARDPWPFLSMPVTAFQIIAASIRTGQSFGEVSTADISWFEDAD